MANKIRVKVMDEQGRSLGDLEADELAQHITKLPRVTEIAKESGYIKLPIKFTDTIPFLLEKKSLAIDRTGSKHKAGWLVLDAENLEQLASVRIGAHLGAPSASDATVEIRLVDFDVGEVVGTITFEGVGGTRKSSIDASAFDGRAGHRFYFEFYVTSASATSGATQDWYSAWLLLIFDYTP